MTEPLLELNIRPATLPDEALLQVATVDQVKYTTAALILSGLTLFLSILAANGVQVAIALGFNWLSLVYVALYMGIAWGIWRKSRVAAVCGLALFLFSITFSWIFNNVTPRAMAFLWILIFFNGIRGTFALHDLKARQANEGG